MQDVVDALDERSGMNVEVGVASWVVDRTDAPRAATSSSCQNNITHSFSLERTLRPGR